MSIRAFAVLTGTLLAAKPLMAESIPFVICAESTTWTCPEPEVQAKDLWH